MVQRWRAVIAQHLIDSSHASAVLQHPRLPELQLLDFRGSGQPRRHPGVCRWLSSRAMADAALVPQRAGQVVPRRQSRRAAGYRRRFASPVDQAREWPG